MSASPIKFGTDGWRAIIAEDYTFANVRACAQGVAGYLLDTGKASQGLVIGYDTRFASEDFAGAVAEVVAASGIPVYLGQRPCPTPAVSYNILHRRAAGGVVITASHNPPQWNGFKYKTDYGGSASPEVIAQLEARIATAQRTRSRKSSPVARAIPAGAVTTVDLIGPYVDRLRTLVDLAEIRDAPLTIAIDSMYGSGAGILRGLLEGSHARVIELHGERNPTFPGMRQPEPIAGNLHALAETVLSAKASVGLATDGDADRLGVLDERGKFVTQLQALALLALYKLEVQGERGPLVKSITAGSMLFRLGDLYNVPVFETPVGFKYVGPVMVRESALIGGEESGGYAFRGHIPERDGILSALYLLSMMVRLQQRPSQLIDYLYQKVGPHHYDRIDLRFDPAQRDAVLARMEQARPKEIDGTPVVAVDLEDGYRFRLAGGAWTLLRFSGTEPLLRIYSEASSLQRVQRLLQETRRLAGV